MSSYRSNTETFYREIIQKVSNQVKEDFHNEGIGEDVIQDLIRVNIFIKLIELDREINSYRNIPAYTFCYSSRSCNRSKLL
jgi:hypothetical protein